MPWTRAIALSGAFVNVDIAASQGNWTIRKSNGQLLWRYRGERRNEMSTILIVVLVLLLLGVLPTWPHSANWGYGPSGLLGLILLILLILALTGRL